jgi:hypothetical protein
MFHPTSALLNSCEIAGTSHYQSICIIIVDIKEPHEEALEQLMNETQESTSAPVANLGAPAGKRKAEDELHNEPTDYSDENSDDHSDEEAELQSFPEYSGARSKSIRRSHRRREKICAKGSLVVEFLLRSIDDREPCLFEFAKSECPALRPLMVKAWVPNIEDVHELELTLLVIAYQSFVWRAAYYQPVVKSTAIWYFMGRTRRLKHSSAVRKWI